MRNEVLGQAHVIARSWMYSHIGQAPQAVVAILVQSNHWETECHILSMEEVPPRVR
jgi:hypothetical protein